MLAKGQRIMNEQFSPAQPSVYGQSGAEQETAAEKNPDCGTMGAGWRDPPRDQDL
jgi:hypothetical protein